MPLVSVASMLRMIVCAIIDGVPQERQFEAAKRAGC